MLVRTMKLYNRGNLGGSLMMTLASTRFASAFVPHHLMATSLSLNFRQVGAIGYGSSNTVRAMSKMNQSFDTWSFDESCKSMAWTEMAKASLSAETKSDDWDQDADLVIVGVFAPKKKDEDTEEEGDEDEDKEEEVVVDISGAAKDLDDKLDGALSNVMTENAKAFKNGATAGSVTPALRIFSDGKSQRVVVVGLGTEPSDDDEKTDPLAGVGSALGKALATTCNSEKKVKTAKLLLPETVAADATVMKDLSTAFFSNLYSDNRFRTKKNVVTPAEDLETVTIVSEGSSIDGAEEALEAGKKLAAGVYMTKDIVNSPHNVLNSESLAETAKRIAEESGGSLTCTILGKEECEERGMGAYLGVARGSETEPQFIHLTYTPEDGTVNKKVGVIGKGLLFDTGGYNIKTGMMELMKFDCGGAAAVLGKLVTLSILVGFSLSLSICVSM